MYEYTTVSTLSSKRLHGDDPASCDDDLDQDPKRLRLEDTQKPAPDESSGREGPQDHEDVYKRIRYTLDKLYFPFENRKNLEFAATGVIIQDLENDIHPILQQSCWLGISDQLYRRMTPVLRLVSFVITEKKLSSWFVHTATGLATSSSTGRIYLAKSAIAESIGHEIVKAAFSELSDNIEWSFASIEPCGITMFPSGQKTKIELSISHFLAYLEDGAMGPRTLHDLHTELFLAQTILYELGHAFYDACQLLEDDEPSHTFDEHFNEMGASCVTSTMGGELIPVSGAASSVMTTWSASLLREYSKLGTKESDLIWNFSDETYIIPPNWAQQWFLKATWERIRNKGPQFLYNLLQSWKLSSTTTKGIFQDSMSLVFKASGKVWTIFDDDVGFSDVTVRRFFAQTRPDRYKARRRSTSRKTNKRRIKRHSNEAQHLRNLVQNCECSRHDDHPNGGSRLATPATADLPGTSPKNNGTKQDTSECKESLVQKESEPVQDTPESDRDGKKPSDEVLPESSNVQTPSLGCNAPAHVQTSDVLHEIISGIKALSLKD